MSYKSYDEYRKALADCLNKDSLEEFCKFTRKNRVSSMIVNKGVVEITMHKLRCEMKEVYPKLKKASKEWLMSKGMFAGISGR